MPRSAVPLLKRVWIAELRPICSMHSPPPPFQCLRALRQTVGIKTATKAPMWNHTKSSIIIRHTLSKLWTSRLISCHYSQIGWSGVCHWSAFLVAGLVWPIGGWAQVYILGWVIYKETTDQTPFLSWHCLCLIGPGLFIFVHLSARICQPLVVIFLVYCELRIVNIRGCYSALSWECCYHLLRLLLRVSHKQGSQFRPEWGWGEGKIKRKL